MFRANFVKRHEIRYRILVPYYVNLYAQKLGYRYTGIGI
jgi:hypothetical protein